MSGGRFFQPKQRCGETFDQQIRIMQLWAQQDRWERAELVGPSLFRTMLIELMVMLVSEPCGSLEVDAPGRANFETLKPGENV